LNVSSFERSTALRIVYSHQPYLKSDPEVVLRESSLERLSEVLSFYRRDLIGLANDGVGLNNGFSY